MGNFQQGVPSQESVGTEPEKGMRDLTFSEFWDQDVVNKSAQGKTSWFLSCWACDTLQKAHLFLEKIGAMEQSLYNRAIFFIIYHKNVTQA